MSNRRGNRRVIAGLQTRTQPYIRIQVVDTDLYPVYPYSYDNSFTYRFSSPNISPASSFYQLAYRPYYIWPSYFSLRRLIIGSLRFYHFNSAIIFITNIIISLSTVPQLGLIRVQLSWLTRHLRYAYTYIAIATLHMVQYRYRGIGIGIGISRYVRAIIFLPLYPFIII